MLCPKNISNHWYIEKATTCSAEEYAFEYLQHINCCLLVWGNKSGKILQLQKKAIRAVTCAGYISHSEPLFKLFDIL